MDSIYIIHHLVQFCPCVLVTCESASFCLGASGCSAPYLDPVMWVPGEATPVGGGRGGRLRPGEGGGGAPV